MSTPSGLVELMPFAAGIGVVIDSASPDRVVGHLDWAERLCTAGAVMHGGALMTLADTVGAACAFLGLPEGAATATTSSTTQLMRAVSEGTATATAVTLHRGRRQIVVQTGVRDGAGNLVALTTQTQAVLS